MYADDIQLYLSFSPDALADATIRLNKDLSEINRWCRKNSLVINVSKCNNILVGSEKNLKCLAYQPLFLGDEALPRVEQVRSLGLLLDSGLAFSQQVNNVCKTAYFCLRQLSPFRRELPEATKLLLVESLVLSHFNYMSTVYGPLLTLENSYKIQKVQNSCIRFCRFFNYRDHITPVLREFGLLNMSERRFVQYVCFVLSITKSGEPLYLNSKLEKRTNVHTRDLRHVNATYTIPNHRMENFKCSFSYLAPHVLNNLPGDCRSLSSQSVKQRLKSSILSDTCQFVAISRF